MITCLFVTTCAILLPTVTTESVNTVPNVCRHSDSHVNNCREALVDVKIHKTDGEPMFIEKFGNDVVVELFDNLTCFGMQMQRH
jgi:hypothetical protein